MSSHSWREIVPEREKRLWYLLNPNTDTPTHAVGLRCPEPNDDMWWFPSLGWSVPATKLCVTEDAARAMAIAELKEQIKKLQRKVKRLEAPRG